MLLRKSRKHLHGASNKSLYAHLTFSNSQPSTKEIKLDKAIFNSTSHLKKRIDHKKNFNSNLSGFINSAQNRRCCQIQLKLRRVYQKRRNIVKLVDGWGFSSQGMISRRQFKDQVQQKIGTKLTEEELTCLLLKSGASQSSMDVKALINLIHGKNEGSMFNQTLFDPTSFSKERETKIQNLKENIRAYDKSQQIVNNISVDKLLCKINNSISKMKQINDGKMKPTKDQFFEELVKLNTFGNGQRQIIDHIKSSIDYYQVKDMVQAHKSVDFLIIDPILRKTRKQLLVNKQIQTQNLEATFTNIMRSVSNLGKTTKFEQKKRFFDPTTMSNINQQKTRFGNSNFTYESQNWKEKEQTRQRVTPNQKQQILQTIKSQQNMHRLRYQHKLQKIRIFKQIEQQNIAKQEQNNLVRDQKRLQRMKNEQQAYNYVNFIKKKWQ